MLTLCFFNKGAGYICNLLPPFMVSNMAVEKSKKLQTDPFVDRSNKVKYLQKWNYYRLTVFNLLYERKDFLVTLLYHIYLCMSLVAESDVCSGFKSNIPMLRRSTVSN